MEDQSLPQSPLLRAALLGAAATILSTITALAVTYLVRYRRNGGETGRSKDVLIRERVPIQPAVDTVVTAQVPHHFTEDLIVPGYTFTGEQVAEQDDVDGRSPEGV